MAYFTGPNIVQDGLVLALDAGSTRSYPGTGTTWYDLSGNENNFTFSGTPSISGGLFDNEGSVYASRSAIPVNSATNGYTIEVCFKINVDLTTGYQNVFQNGTSPNRHMVWYFGSSDNLNALFHIPNGYNNISDALSLNTFYYLQMAYSPSGGGSNGRRAWINGVEKTVNNTAAGNVTSAGTSTIGIDNNLSSGQSDMSYAFIRYYDKGLSEAEISQNYNAQKTRFGL